VKLTAAIGVTARMNRQLRPLPTVSQTPTRLTAAELRVMLAVAEAREKNEIDRLRAEIEHLRAERRPVSDDPCAAQPLPYTARSLPAVMSVTEAAATLRVSVPTIRNWVKAGKLAAGQTSRGARIMIPRDSVLRLLGERRL
jgi:excisionase family DNA binding protein